VAERLAASSYPADAGLLAELRAVWPPPGAVEGREIGYIDVDLRAAEPVAALRVTDRFAIALATESESPATVVIPLTREHDRWRRATAGDGLSAFVAGVPMASERPIGVDQTNASVVVGERVIVKWFRRTGPEPARATTLLAHLAEVGFAEIPTPLGALTWTSPTGVEETIAQGDAFLEGARDGWEWCVERLERHVAHGSEPCPGDCDPWIGGPLGRLVARLHGALLRPSTVIPEPVAMADASDARRWHAAALSTLDEALRLTEAEPAARGLLAAVGPRMRADIDSLPGDRAVPIQPVHGDLHVGQILDWSGGLAIIDFDGNPTLAGAANELRQPVERDIAQMTSSLDHVGRIVDERTAGERHDAIEEWVVRTRGEFLAELDADVAVLTAFEVEQECRELVYAARYLPRWRYAPLATLAARYGRMNRD
jgi:maltokinase